MDEPAGLMALAEGIEAWCDDADPPPPRHILRAWRDVLRHYAAAWRKATTCDCGRPLGRGLCSVCDSDRRLE